MRNAFTMVEILIVVIILGLVAAFGIPSYTKAISRQKARQAIANLRAVSAANNYYYNRYGTSKIVSGSTLAVSDIDAAFKLNLGYDTSTTYTCSDIMRGSKEEYCTAKNPGDNYTLNLWKNGEVRCTGVACP
ncbi:MAG: type II secretion system protein [Candidatus Omnitrophica bacterium]|nr:type II secretion system protein [Candidatus Omnitrophota bacterium]